MLTLGNRHISLSEYRGSEDSTSEAQRPYSNARLAKFSGNGPQHLERCPYHRSARPTEHVPSVWISYRIDRAGTRIPMTSIPPQGTYKVSDGLSKTDYSDPRDFFAPTKGEQRDVWNALEPTRAYFQKLTGVSLRSNDMRCLGQGYNASWAEMKRKLTQWVFEKFCPDRSGSSRGLVSFLQHSTELSGYATEGTRYLDEQSKNQPKKNLFFSDGELDVNIERLLFRLERWYGLIEDYEFSPNWPYERRRSANGYILQSQDCCACIRCREQQILCHGYREHQDRRCKPCAEVNVICSNEEVITTNVQF